MKFFNQVWVQMPWTTIAAMFAFIIVFKLIDDVGPSQKARLYWWWLFLGVMATEISLDF
jgi:Na+-transporting NADH:ubiquinone oxidoreductase subunit NqrB